MIRTVAPEEHRALAAHLDCTHSSPSRRIPDLRHRSQQKGCPWQGQARAGIESARRTRSRTRSHSSVLDLGGGRIGRLVRVGGRGRKGRHGLCTRAHDGRTGADELDEARVLTCLRKKQMGTNEFCIGRELDALKGGVRRYLEINMN